MRSNSGNNVPNQFVISTPKGSYFQSYQSIIAFKPGEGIDETRAKIESGEYKLTNLN